MSRTRRSVLGRRTTAAYAVGFFLAVAAAPHRHINALEDLLTDGPSDSGFVIEAPAMRGSVPLLAPVRILDDDPCLACFQHDFVAAAVSAFILPGLSAARVRIDPGSLPAIPDPIAGSPASRSPPPAA